MAQFFKNIKVLPGKILIALAFVTLLSACEKFIEITETNGQMQAQDVFESDATANAAINGLYRSMRSAIQTPLIQMNSIYSNEIMPYSNSTGNSYYTLNLQTGDSLLPWSTFYAVVYGANNAIERLDGNFNIPEISRKRYIAEAKFMRAFCHFFMVNLYGDVPLVLTTDVNTNSHISRSAVSSVYTQIIKDLIEAKADLPDDYSHATNERVRANKWVAGALLARAYLYQKDYSNAETEANAIINSGKYSLLTNATGIFNKNNNEAIFQFANNISDTNPANGFIFTSAPVYVCTPVLLNAFEMGDQRKTSWIRTSTYSGQQISAPFKFTSTAANPPEYITMIRLAEMYLIRSEARAMRNDFQGSADDVNLLRLKHGGLAVPIVASADQNNAVTIILHERLVELFTECGHRFFDLKRTGRINAVMGLEKPTYWKPTAALYPIPSLEIQRNPSLTPNPGYE